MLEYVLPEESSEKGLTPYYVYERSLIGGGPFVRKGKDIPNALGEYVTKKSYPAPELADGYDAEGRIFPSMLDKWNIRHTPDRRTFMVTTPEGRPIIAERAGSQDGDLLLSFHGMPGNRRHPLPEGGECMDFVSYDRPGYGLSAPSLGHKPIDSLDDINSLAIYFGGIYTNKKTHLLAGSGGCPHALAGAAKSAFVKRTVVIAPTAPYEAMGEAWFKGMHPFNEEIFRLALCARHSPDDSQFLDTVLYEYAAQIQHDPQGFLLEKLSIRSANSFSDSTRKKGHNLQESLQHTIAGWRNDILGMLEWGFSPQEINKEVLVIYGENDVFSPPHHAEWLIDNIPHAQSVFLPGLTHEEVIIQGEKIGVEWCREYKEMS